MAKKGSFFRGSLQEHWWPGQRLWAGCPPRVGSAPGDGAVTHGGDGDVRVPMPPRRACASHAGGSLRVPGGPRCGWPSTPGPRAAHSVALRCCSVLTEMTACDSVTLGSLGGWLLPFPTLNCRKMTRFFQYKRFKTRVRNSLLKSTVAFRHAPGGGKPPRHAAPLCVHRAAGALGPCAPGLPVHGTRLGPSRLRCHHAAASSSRWSPTARPATAACGSVSSRSPCLSLPPLGVPRRPAPRRPPPSPAQHLPLPNPPVSFLAVRQPHSNPTGPSP